MPIAAAAAAAGGGRGEGAQKDHQNQGSPEAVEDHSQRVEEVPQSDVHSEAEAGIHKVGIHHQVHWDRDKVLVQVGKERTDAVAEARSAAAAVAEVVAVVTALGEQPSVPSNRVSG